MDGRRVAHLETLGKKAGKGRASRAKRVPPTSAAGRPAKIGAGCFAPAAAYEPVERIILGRLREMSIAHLMPATGTTNLPAKEHAALTAELADITWRVARFADANEDEQDALREKLGVWGQRKREIAAHAPTGQGPCR